MKSVRCIGVDPAWAKPLAWSFVGIGSCPDRPALIFSENGSILDFWEFINQYKPDLVAVEDQYMKFNYDTSKKLSWVAGKILGIADVLRIPTKIVNVASWKAKFLGGKSGAYDKTPVEVCKELWKVELTDDKACSALISYYAILQEL